MNARVMQMQIVGGKEQGAVQSATELHNCMYEAQGSSKDTQCAHVCSSRRSKHAKCESPTHI